MAIVGLVVFLGACSEEAPPVNEVEDVLGKPPIGAWIHYGGERSVLEADDFEREETELILADSTYSLTFTRPDIQFVFVETGKVTYDLRGKIARFTVSSTSGVDWSSGVPRKLSLIPESVPFQRDPGMIYRMQYTFQDSLLGLTASDTESSWFVRAPQ